MLPRLLSYFISNRMPRTQFNKEKFSESNKNKTKNKALSGDKSKNKLVFVLFFPQDSLIKDFLVSSPSSGRGEE